MKMLIVLLFPLLIHAQDFSSQLLVVDTGLDAPIAILLTGFGPFGGISNNPSGRVAKLLPTQIESTCGKPEWKITSKKLPVRPGIISEENLKAYSTVISIGVDSGSDRIRLERYARNWYYDPDTGVEHKIDPEEDKNHLLSGGEIPSDIPAFLNGFSIELGNETSAGTYVCNDTFYRLCREHKRGYFIHIPYVSEKRDVQLAASLAGIACKLLSAR